MSLTKEQIADYCKPFLRRPVFRFQHLKGMVDRKILKDLQLAKAFAYPGHECRNFMAELLSARAHLKKPIDSEIDKLLDIPESTRTNRDHFEAFGKIRHIFIEHGIHTSFERPASVGLILNTTEVAGLSAYFFLGECRDTYTGRSRLNLNSNGIGSFEVNITETASRLVQILDYWLMPPEQIKNHPQSFRLILMRTDRNALIELGPQILESAKLFKEEMPVLFALDVACVRLMMARLEKLMKESDSPQAFLCAAINMNIDSAVAHETAHLEESQAHREIKLPLQQREFLGYMLQAAYSEPGDAFRSCMLRGFDISTEMPSFDEDLRSLGFRIFCVGPQYLKEWATWMLDAVFKQLHKGKTHEEVIRPETIKEAQTSDFVRMEHMPLIEKALCNPNIGFEEEVPRTASC